MSFNMDDPLAGILSDGSDDSFFDDDILGSKKTAKKKGTPIAEKKNNLFDLGEGTKTAATAKSTEKLDRKDSLLDLAGPISKNELKTESSKSPAPFRRTVSKESIGLSMDTRSKNVLEENNLDKKKEPLKPLEKGRSSQSLLDDILGGTPTKSTMSQPPKPAMLSKNQEFDIESILGKTESKQTLSSTKSVHKPNLKVENSNSALSKKKSSDDWLGIFQEKKEAPEDDAEMPSWLLGSDKKKKVDKEKKEEANLPAPNEEEKQEPEKAAPVEVTNKPDVAIFEQLTRTLPAPYVAIMHGNTDDITAEGAAMYLQQQESQLMVALQLKAQEEKLVALQTRQKETQRVQREAALANHSQLDAMLKKQADQRHQMQKIISAHQERITQRIKALLDTTDNDNKVDNENTEIDIEHHPDEHKESPHGRERKQLLQLVQSLQENHDKEIDLMETSYRRQLAFLEISINQTEERMKEESDKLEKFYSEKIIWFEEHHNLYKKMSEDNLNSLSERHKSENELLRQQHLDNIKVLQEHHAMLMENIKNAVKQEQTLIHDSAGFSSDLSQLLADVKESKVHCQKLADSVQNITENAQRDLEKSLQMRESQIDDILQQLKKERDNLEIEKTENRNLLKMLEARLKQMTSMLEEETAALKQRKMEFEFDKATFSKQTEFAKNVLKKQDEEMKTLKEDLQKEHEEKLAKMDDERARIVKDSATVSKEKLSINSIKQEVERLKAELQAQLEEVTEERSKLNVEKQQLRMEEQRIIAKTRDLELLAKTAIDKQSQSDQKYSEAEILQRKYEERIRRIQEHVVSLNLREKHIAKEKVALSRERLALHNEKKQLEARQCSLCRSTQNYQPYSNYENTYNNLPESFRNPVSRDYNYTLGSGNLNPAMNTIEQEMTRIIGRNYDMVRHSAGDSNMCDLEDRFDDKIEMQDEIRATTVRQPDSGAFKDFMDPKFMMLRLDVQKVISNLEHSKRNEAETSDVTDDIKNL